MIAVDTNVLVHAHRQNSPEHDAAHACVVALAESPCRWAIPVFCIGEFVRVITHPRLFHAPHSAEEACEAVSKLLASSSVTVLCPGTENPALLTEAIHEADGHWEPRNIISSQSGGGPRSRSSMTVRRATSKPFLKAIDFADPDGCFLRL